MNEQPPIDKKEAETYPLPHGAKIITRTTELYRYKATVQANIAELPYANNELREVNAMLIVNDLPKIEVMHTSTLQLDVPYLLDEQGLVQFKKIFQDQYKFAKAEILSMELIGKTPNAVEQPTPA